MRLVGAAESSAGPALSYPGAMPIAVMWTVAVFGGLFFTALGFVLSRIDRRLGEPREAQAGRKLMLFGLGWMGVAAVLYLLLVLFG